MKDALEMGMGLGGLLPGISEQKFCLRITLKSSEMLNDLTCALADGFLNEFMSSLT